MAENPNPPKKVPPLPPPTGGKPPLKTPPAPPGMRAPGLPPRPPSAGQPPLPPASRAPTGSPADAEERMRRMEDQARDLEESKRRLEKTLSEMELKLKEEKEKALYQAVKAREEEALSLKMEQALKEMQEKSRAARREQELEEARARAEEKVKDLERRLNEEREAWVINLKKQMEMRDSETKQMESQLEIRFKDLERRWVEEKAMLTQAIKAKEGELEQMRAYVSDAQSQVRRAQEESAHQLELTRKRLEQDFEIKKEEILREKKALADRLDLRERELVSLKAQLAMIDSQVKAAQEASARNLQERERTWQFQLSELQRDLSGLRQAKDQLQGDLARANAENAALRKENGEVHELKSKLARSGDSGYIEQSLRDALAKREKELAALRSELMEIEQSLEKKFSREKESMREEIERRHGQELAAHGEVLHRQLAETQEAVFRQLEELEQRVQEEQKVFFADLEQNHPKIKEAQARVQDLERQVKALREESEKERTKDFEAFEKEKQRLAVEQERAVGALKEEVERLRREAERQAELPPPPPPAPIEFALPAEEERKGLFARLLDYLNSPVIELDEKDRKDER